MERGYVKLWRRMLDSKVFSNPEVLKLWIWCLVRANHKASFVDVGLADPVRVDPGSFITGRYQMHAEYYQKKKRGTRSPLTLWRWLLRLQTWSKLNIKATNRYTLVTVTNWAQYQGAISKNDQPMNSRRTAGEQPVNTDKNDKNDKNDKKNPPLPPAGGIAFELARLLIDSTQKATGRTLTAKPAGSVAAIKQLLKSVDEQAVRTAIAWLCGENLKREFAFVVHSGRSLREKWDRIQSAMAKRDAGKDSHHEQNRFIAPPGV